jgi:ring-1,2-phenylacetyl-CoA epoxidase subunit PaaE
MNLQRHVWSPVRVLGKRMLTPDAAELTLDLPAGFAHQAGQNLPVRAVVDGQELRRTYSICTPPGAGPARIAVKRAGAFSTWAVDRLEPGQAIEARPPEGRFTVGSVAGANGSDAGPRHFAAVAAGSGITPVLALARDRLEGTPGDTFTLVYSNRTTAETMFVEELAGLKDRHPGRFTLHHVLTRERRGCDALSGRLEPSKLDLLLGSQAQAGPWDGVFLCGPMDLVKACRAHFAARGVAKGAVKFELFAVGGRPAAPRPRPARASDAVHTVQFRLDGTTATATTPAGAEERLLHAALRVRADVPYSCSGGVCGTCRARLVDGRVRMVENYALDESDLARGLVLTCQSVAVTPRVELDYDTI